MSINKKQLEIAIKKTMEGYSGRNVKIYSKPGLRVLTYFERTLPCSFSKGIMAATILEREVAAKYPDEWAYVSARIPKITRAQRKYTPTIDEIMNTDLPAPVDIKTVAGKLQLTYSTNVLSTLKALSLENMQDPDLPELRRVSTPVLIKVDDLLSSSEERLISVYSARVAAVMRYLTDTVVDADIKFKPGREVASLLEKGLKDDYLELF